MARTKEQKLARATATLKQLAAKRARYEDAERRAATAASPRDLARALADAAKAAWTSKDSEDHIAAALLLADGIEKSISLEDARAWRADFVAAHPEAVAWASEFVGRAQVHNTSRRGPKPNREQAELPGQYYQLVHGMLKQRGITSGRLGKQQIEALHHAVNGACDAHMLPRLSRQELAFVVRRVRAVR